MEQNKACNTLEMRLTPAERQFLEMLKLQDEVDERYVPVNEVQRKFRGHLEEESTVFGK